MKFRKILLGTLARKDPFVPYVEKYPAVFIGQRPVGQNLDVANIADRDPLDALEGLVEIIMCKMIYTVRRRKIFWQ